MNREFRSNRQRRVGSLPPTTVHPVTQRELEATIERLTGDPKIEVEEAGVEIEEPAESEPLIEASKVETVPENKLIELEPEVELEEEADFTNELLEE